MALRAKGGIELSKKSAKVGERIEAAVKVENTGAEPARLRLVATLHEGALRKPVEHPMVCEPVQADVSAKSRTRVAFAWVAALPEGKTGYTYRGVLAMVDDAGAEVGASPLDLYVSS